VPKTQSLAFCGLWYLKQALTALSLTTRDQVESLQKDLDREALPSTQPKPSFRGQSKVVGS
jgi:hypothetical protein